MGITHGRKYNNKRKRTAPSTKAVMYKRPSARNQQVQIARLAAAVRTNQRRIATARYLVQHKTSYPTQSIQNPTGYGLYQAFSLSNPQFMTQIFGDPEEAKGGKYTGKTLRVDFQMSMGKSTKATDMTAFIIRPKTQKVVNEVGLNATANITPTAANPNPLTSGTDYSYQDGLALMNPKRWHIDKMWKLQIRPDVAPFSAGGAPPQQITNLVSQDNMVRRSFSMKNPLYINSRTDVWSAVNPQDLAPRQRAFLIVFNNATPLATPTSPPVGPTIEGFCHTTAHTSE